MDWWGGGHAQTSRGNRSTGHPLSASTAFEKRVGKITSLVWWSIQHRLLRLPLQRWWQDEDWQAPQWVSYRFQVPERERKYVCLILHLASYLNPRATDEVSVPRTQVTHTGDTIPIGALREFRQFMGKFLPETTDLDISFGRVCW